MKKELTREAVEAITKCSKTSGDCSRCGAYEFCREKSASFRFEELATALLEEMDKPKVWDGAPEEAVKAHIEWFDKNGWYSRMNIYARELQKTRARQIAEEVISENVGGVEDKVSLLTDLIETALEKYAAELKEQ